MNYELGKDNKLLWHLPEDMKYFKEQTEFFNVVMGNNTFKSLPFENGLPNRVNWVLTKDELKHYAPAKQKVKYLSLPAMQYVLNTMGKYETYWIIGGASVYEQLIEFVDEVHWTEVMQEFPDADTYLPIKVVDEIGNKFRTESVGYFTDSATGIHFSISVMKRK